MKGKIVTVTYSYTDLIDNAISATEDYYYAIYAIEEVLNKKWNSIVKKELKYIAQSAVDEFYEDYDPKHYDRKNDLSNAYEIVVDDDTWKIDMGYEFMEHEHEADNEYIYINSFENGFHGGAIDGPDHPNPGEPWWRKGPAAMPFVFWYKPAKPGPSIADKIRDEAGKFIEKAMEQYDEEYDRLIKPYFDKFIKAIYALKRG